MSPADWTLRLRFPGLRPGAVAEALEIYRLTGSLDVVAERLRVSKRTLERWIVRIPELAAGVEAQRKRWGTVRK